MERPRPLWDSATVAAVPADAPPADLATTADLRTLLTTARAVAHSTGPSGTALRALVERLGLTARVRLVQAPPGTPAGHLLTDGRADLAFQQHSELADLPASASSAAPRRHRHHLHLRRRRPHRHPRPGPAPPPARPARPPRHRRSPAHRPGPRNAPAHPGDRPSRRVTADRHRAGRIRFRRTGPTAYHRGHAQTLRLQPRPAPRRHRHDHPPGPPGRHAARGARREVPRGGRLR
ncbi:substrate-binding domain-containing protein [Kitasatospora fiedleri]|uniref:substrate-binding domain-containing protein n=1 Tax=Kitasatospora fiedleri TaxID=2991545 RepID=UPI00384A9654